MSLGGSLILSKAAAAAPLAFLSLRRSLNVIELGGTTAPVDSLCAAALEVSSAASNSLMEEDFELVDFPGSKPPAAVLWSDTNCEFPGENETKKIRLKSINKIKL